MTAPYFREGRNWFWLVVLVLAGAGFVRLLTPELPVKIKGLSPKVVDGDSLVFGGVRVRLSGIDAPEGAQTCRLKGRDWACGAVAARRLARLVKGRQVVCRSERFDQYGRVLATCRTGQGLEINNWMVEKGWAVAYGQKYAVQSARARRDSRGIWAGEFEKPRDWRRKKGEDCEFLCIPVRWLWSAFSLARQQAATVFN